MSEAPTAALSVVTAVKDALLDVRRYVIEEEMSGLFSAAVWATSARADLNLEAIVDQEAAIRVVSGHKLSARAGRTWLGVCAEARLVSVETTGESQYFLRVVPRLWLLDQRIDYRVFQHKSTPAIVKQILERWGVTATWKIDDAAYKKHWYKIQYGESDYALVSRLLEDAGIAFIVDHEEDKKSELIFADKLHGGTKREEKLHFVANPNQARDEEYVTNVTVRHGVRPGAVTLRDHDLRRPGFALFAHATSKHEHEAKLEHYEFAPGSFLVEGAKSDPAADDQGGYRHDENWGKAAAERRLDALRADKLRLSFDGNCIDLDPGLLVAFDNHPHPDLAAERQFLVTRTRLEGKAAAECRVHAEAVVASEHYRPPRRTPRPVVRGVQSALVVGPTGADAIHTDEHGRVRVQFPWDREGKRDDHSSCWLRVSQACAGPGFGTLHLPRIGHEVLVEFAGGNPDEPLIVGRLFSPTRPYPHSLPGKQMVSAWRSSSNPGADGANELSFDDSSGAERVTLQVERDFYQLVKNDELVTVGANRGKHVKGDELEAGEGSLHETTVGNRVEIDQAKSTAVADKKLDHLVKGTRHERIDGDQWAYTGGDQHLSVAGSRRLLVEKAAHRTVKGEEREAIEGLDATGIGKDSRESAAASHALQVGGALYFKAPMKLVIDASDITIKAPGGFIRIGASGVSVGGDTVKLNSGGSAGSGKVPKV